MRRVLRILKIIRRRRWKWLLKIALKLKAPKRATTTPKTIVRKQKVVVLKRPPPFILKVPVNIAKTLMCTRHWSWNVLNAFGTITTRFVLYAITRSPRREITSKRAFFGVTIVEQLHTKTPRRWKPIFIHLQKRRTKKRTNFHPFQIAVYLPILSLVYNKVFKIVSRVLSIYLSRVLTDPC